MAPLLAHPSPPYDFAKSSLPLILQSGPWNRLHSRHHSALHFGKAAYRFSAHDKRFGVLYVGDDEHVAFIETFGHTTGIDVVTRVELEATEMSEVETSRPLRLVNLTDGTSLVRLGADARLWSGDHAIAQVWASAIYAHPDSVDGIYYPSRRDPSRRAAAIFDRAQLVISARPLGSLLGIDGGRLLAKILDEYGFGLIET